MDYPRDNLQKTVSVLLTQTYSCN